LDRNVFLNTLLSQTTLFSQSKRLLFKLIATTDKMLVYCVYWNVFGTWPIDNYFNRKMAIIDL